jgi:hypothetical protein
MQRPRPLSADAPATGITHPHPAAPPNGKSTPGVASTWFKPQPPKKNGDDSLPRDWVQMRAANVVGVVLMFVTGFLNFFAGASMSVVSLLTPCISC